MAADLWPMVWEQVGPMPFSCLQNVAAVRCAGSETSAPRACGQIARLPHRSLQSSRLPEWNQMPFTVADEISAAHLPERFTQQPPILGVVVAQKSFVQPALFESLAAKTTSPRSR